MQAQATLHRVFMTSLLIAGALCATVARAQSGDRAILIELYHATGGEGWKDSNSWLTDDPLDWWRGVMADGDQVTQLSLNMNGLVGRLPPSLGNLSSLRLLSLQHNDLSGPIPPRLGNLSNLEFLSLRDNDLSGTIPPELGALGSLRTLGLSGNRLSGRIPPALANLSNLVWLNLGDEFYDNEGRSNLLSGPIPSFLGDMTTLRGLRLLGNQLSGRIPVELVSCLINDFT